LSCANGLGQTAVVLARTKTTERYWSKLNRLVDLPAKSGGRKAKPGKALRLELLIAESDLRAERLLRTSGRGQQKECSRGHESAQRDLSKA
jgi:hypothetical protein